MPCPGILGRDTIPGRDRMQLIELFSADSFVKCSEHYAKHPDVCQGDCPGNV